MIDCCQRLTANIHWDWQHCFVHHKKVDNEHAKSSCAPPNLYKAKLYTTKVYVGEPWFACPLLTTKVLYILYVLVHHLCMFVVNTPYKSTFEHPIQTRSVHFFACSLWTLKKWKMSGANPTSHRHRSPLCTMVHKGARWCTIQVCGAQRSPVHTRWCTT